MTTIEKVLAVWSFVGWGMFVCSLLMGKFTGDALADAENKIDELQNDLYATRRQLGDYRTAVQKSMIALQHHTDESMQ